MNRKNIVYGGAVGAVLFTAGAIGYGIGNRNNKTKPTWGLYFNDAPKEIVKDNLTFRSALYSVGEDGIQHTPDDVIRYVLAADNEKHITEIKEVIGVITKIETRSGNVSMEYRLEEVPEDKSVESRVE